MLLRIVSNWQLPAVHFNRWRDKAEELLQALDAILAMQRCVGPLAFVMLYRALDDNDAALERYEKAFDAREGIAATFGMDPSLDPLRSEPKFQALMRRLKLPGAGW